MKSSGTAAWEESDFPLVCQACLGPNQHLRMTRLPFGLECRVCLKPFTLFRWCPDPPETRFRRTEICSSCARLKQVCQSCLLDLRYGLPVQVRDRILGVREEPPREEANREFFLAARAQREASGLGRALLPSPYQQVDPAADAILSALANNARGREQQTGPRRNRRLPCSFFAKGACNRGDRCPYLHELVAARPSTLRSFRDRYYGQNDPDAASLLEAASTIAQPLLPPADRSVTALHVAGLPGDLAADEKRTAVEEHFGRLGAAVRHVRLLETGTAAIVAFRTRSDAEKAADASIGLVQIGVHPVRVTWAHRGGGAVSDAHRPKYPSQDPERFGSRPEK